MILHVLTIFTPDIHNKWLFVCCEQHNFIYPPSTLSWNGLSFWFCYYPRFFIPLVIVFAHIFQWNQDPVIVAHCFRCVCMSVCLSVNISLNFNLGCKSGAGTWFIFCIFLVTLKWHQCWPPCGINCVAPYDHDRSYDVFRTKQDICLYCPSRYYI